MTAALDLLGCPPTSRRRRASSEPRTARSSRFPALQGHQEGRGLLIVDESTRSLSCESRVQVVSIVDSLLAEGASVLLISHQLDEIIEAGDRVIVLRDGEVVEADIQTANVDEASLTRAILGRHLESHRRGTIHATGENVSAVSALAAPGVKPFDRTVRRDEITGLTGLTGLPASGYDDVTYLQQVRGRRPQGRSAWTITPSPWTASATARRSSSPPAWPSSPRAKRTRAYLAG